jgi:hypothetical protein
VTFTQVNPLGGKGGTDGNQEGGIPSVFALPGPCGARFPHGHFEINEVERYLKHGRSRTRSTQ